jgi:GNAT superfamily N-acetyltransferase
MGRAHTTMSNVTIVFDPYAGPAHREIVDNIVSFHNIAVTGQAEWYPVAFFLKDKRGEVLGGVLGGIWAAGLHIGTLGVTAPMRGSGYGKQLMEQAELYAVERGCTMAFLETFSFQARPFYEKLGYRVCGMIEDYPAGHQLYFMTKRLNAGSRSSTVTVQR